jgi:hypothetical protein
LSIPFLPINFRSEKVSCRDAKCPRTRAAAGIATPAFQEDEGVSLGGRMIYQSIIEKMNEENIEYLVAGGIAVNLYGYIRATMDLDILMVLDDINIGKFIKIVKDLGYKPRVPVSLDDFSNAAARQKWMREKGMKVFSVYNPVNAMEHVDVLLEESIDIRKAFERREVVRSGDLAINLVHIDDLIRLKEIAGRERDKIDVKALAKIKELRNER